MLITISICVTHDAVGTGHKQSETSTYPIYTTQLNHASFDKTNSPVKRRAKMKDTVTLGEVRNFFLNVWTTVGKLSDFFCAALVEKEQPYPLKKGAFFLANRSRNTSVGPIIFPAYDSSGMLITFYFRFISHRTRRGSIFYKPMRVLVRVWRGFQIRLINYCDNDESGSVGSHCRAKRWQMDPNSSIFCRLVHDV